MAETTLPKNTFFSLSLAQLFYQNRITPWFTVNPNSLLGSFFFLISPLRDHKSIPEGVYFKLIFR